MVPLHGDGARDQASMHMHKFTAARHEVLVARRWKVRSTVSERCLRERERAMLRFGSSTIHAKVVSRNL